jgi:hypothetical protein
MVRSFLIIGIVLTALIPFTSMCADAVPHAEAIRIKSLIQQLGSDDFSDRELAEEALNHAGRDAEQPLIAAATSGDTEIHVRAARALSLLRWRIGCEDAEQWLAKLGATMGAEKPGAAAPNVEYALGGVDTRLVPENPDALEWLSRAQDADGKWDSKKYGAQADGDIEQTALATLAFLGAGHSEKSGLYKENVKRALAWLRSQQRPDGAFAKPGQPADGIAHALAGMAMAEAAGYARKDETINSAQCSVEYSAAVLQLRTRDERSGFVRNVDSKDADLLTTMFAVMQLKSAKVGGLKVPHESFEGADAFVQKCVSPSGAGFGFVPSQMPSTRATFAGCLCMQFLGHNRMELENWALRGYENFTPSTGQRDSDPLLNYIGTLVIFQTGNVNAWSGPGSTLWQSWSDQMRQNVAAAMCKEGEAAGSWDPSGTWASGGRVLTTALHALSFEIYYRYRAIEPEKR